MADSDSLSSSSNRDLSSSYPIHSEPIEREEAAGGWAWLRARIADRRRWPRSWWWPPLPEKVDFSDEDLRRQHDEVSRAINKSLLGLVAFAFFCELALGTPETSLVARDAGIKLPLAGTEIYFATFLIIGPLVLIVFSLYLQILVGYWLTLSRRLESTHPGLPFVFNLRGRVAGYFSNFLFYWLVPVILASFAWKALPRPEAPWPILFFGTSTVALLFAQIRRRLDPPPQAGSAALWLAVFATACITVLAAVGPLLGEALINRPLNLWKADLSKQDLRGVNFRGAYLLEANLHGAHLEGANLTGALLESANLSGASLQKARLKGAHLMGAYLYEANLKEADLQGADLKEAVLDKSNLEGADLEGASLIHTRLKEANLKGAILSRADLQRADLRGTDLRKANLAGANLRIAYLKDANLEDANLTAAVLEHANLHGVNLKGANLRLAQLKGAKLAATILQGANLQGADLTDTAKNLIGEPNLSQEQINSAHGDEKTKLPPEIVAPDSWKR
jgi:uncharacterized protein YjbI with pentapeptide repeats